MSAAYSAVAPEDGELAWNPDHEAMKEKKASTSQRSSIQLELERRLKLLDSGSEKGEKKPA